MVEKPKRRSRGSNTCSTTTKSTRTSTTLIVSHDVQACGRLEHQEDNLAVKLLIRVIEQLQAFFARQGDFNRRLEEQLEGRQMFPFNFSFMG